MRYTGIWPSTNWKRWCCLSARVCHLQFHIRYFSTAILPSTQDRSEGLLLSRKLGQFSSAREEKHVESRVAIAMNTTLDSNPAYYSMVILADHDTNFLDHVEGSDGIKLSPNKKFIGITVFQVVILHLLNEGNRKWAVFLESIKTVLYEEVCDVFLGIPNVS